jgi:hypothetical protein
MFNEKKKYVNWKQGGKNFFRNIINKKYDEDLNLEKLILNPNVNWNFIKKYLYHPQGSQIISGNPHITGKILKYNSSIELDMYYTHNPNIKIGVDLDISDFPFDLYSQNPYINIEIIKKYKNESWDWVELSQNKGITWKDMEDNPELPWSEESKHLNPNNTLELLEKHYNMDMFYSDVDYEFFAEFFIFSERDLIKYKDILNWDILCQNSSITWEMIKNNTDLPWVWEILSENPNITLDIIESNPDKDWDFNNLFGNPNIDKEYILKNKKHDECYALKLCNNHFIYNEAVYRRNKVVDIKYRQFQVKFIFEKISYFSRNIDRIIWKRLLYV